MGSIKNLIPKRKAKLSKNVVFELTQSHSTGQCHDILTSRVYLLGASSKNGEITQAIPLDEYSNDWGAHSCKWIPSISNRCITEARITLARQELEPVGFCVAISPYLEAHTDLHERRGVVGSRGTMFTTIDKQGLPVTFFCNGQWTTIRT